MLESICPSIVKDLIASAHGISRPHGVNEDRGSDLSAIFLQTGKVSTPQCFGLIEKVRIKVASEFGLGLLWRSHVKPREIL